MYLNVLYSAVQSFVSQTEEMKDKNTQHANYSRHFTAEPDVQQAVAPCVSSDVV